MAGAALLPDIRQPGLGGFSVLLGGGCRDLLGFLGFGDLLGFNGICSCVIGPTAASKSARVSGLPLCRRTFQRCRYALPYDCESFRILAVNSSIVITQAIERAMISRAIQCWSIPRMLATQSEMTTGL